MQTFKPISYNTIKRNTTLASFGPAEPKEEKDPKESA